MVKPTSRAGLFFGTITRWLLPVWLLAACALPGLAQVRAEVRVDTRTTLHKIDPKTTASSSSISAGSFTAVCGLSCC